MSTPYLDALNSLFGSNLKRLWPLNESSGSVANDLTNNQDGTYVGGTLGQDALSSDGGASSVLLDGTDDYIRQATEGLFGGSQSPPFAIFCLFKNGTAQTETVIAGWSRNTSSRRSYAIVINGSGNFALWSNNNSNTPNTELVSSSVAANDGEMHLVVGVWASSTDRRLYVDGVLAASTTNSFTFGTSGTNQTFDVGKLLDEGGSPYSTDPGNIAGGPFLSGLVEYGGYATQAPTTEQVEALWAALQTTGPTPESAATNTTGDEVQVGFEATVSESDATGWSLKAGGESLGLSLSGGGTNSVFFQPSRSILHGEVVTISYDASVGDAQVGGEPVASFTDFPVTNNVPSTDPFTPGTLSEQSVTHESITVAWTDSTDGTDPVTAQLQISPAGQDDWTNVSGATASPHTVPSLSPETSYDLRVVYTDDDSNEVTSNVVTSTTVAEPGESSSTYAVAASHLAKGLASTL